MKFRAKRQQAYPPRRRSASSTANRAANPPMNTTSSRRQFLGQVGSGAGSAALAWSGAWAIAAEPKKCPKVAAILTVLHNSSHAHVILENFLEPSLRNGKRTAPGVEVVSFYADQRP